MSGSENFGIRYSTKFESTYGRILRKHYRKNAAAQQEFVELMEAMVEAIASNPFLRGSVKEPWPGAFSRPGCDLCKLKFDMPNLKGASRLGRVLYLVDRQGKEVHFLWVYTHQEFVKQPPTKDLGKVVREAIPYLKRN